MNKIEELKKELAEKKARLSEINAILATVKSLEKEKIDLIGVYRDNGIIKRLERKLEVAILSDKLSRAAQYHYEPMVNCGKTEPCAIVSITDKVIAAYSANNKKLEFRVSDGMEKGSRSDARWASRIDAQGAIAAYNGLKND